MSHLDSIQNIFKCNILKFNFAVRKSHQNSETVVVGGKPTLDSGLKNLNYTLRNVYYTFKNDYDETVYGFIIVLI